MATAKLYHAMTRLREQVKLLHFQTHSYAVHKATDWFVSEYDQALDVFWETYQGSGARIKNIPAINLQDTTDITDIEPLLSLVVELLRPVRKAMAARDNIVDLIEQFRYMLTFG